MRDLSERVLLRKIKKHIFEPLEKFGKDFKHYTTNNVPVPGTSPEEQDARRRRQDYEKTKQQRP